MIRFNISDLIKSIIPQFSKIKIEQIEPKGKIESASNYKDEEDEEETSPNNEEKLIVTPEDPEWIYADLRKEPRGKGSRGTSKGVRNWSKVKGITLHQTAVQFGTNPKRLLNVPVHGATLKDGKIVLLHDPIQYLWHAHSLNKADIGIEISCRAAGIEGNEKTFWRSKKEKENNKKYKDLVDEATDIQIEATKELCRYYINLVAKNGGKIEFIHAHRQGHSSRVSDPGSRIWKLVAIPIMEEFGLSCGPIGWKVGSGTPIPEAWDETNGKGVRYSGSIKGF